MQDNSLLLYDFFFFREIITLRLDASYFTVISYQWTFIILYTFSCWTYTILLLTLPLDTWISIRVQGPLLVLGFRPIKKKFLDFGLYFSCGLINATIVLGNLWVCLVSNLIPINNSKFWKAIIKSIFRSNSFIWPLKFVYFPFLIIFVWGPKILIKTLASQLI